MYTSNNSIQSIASEDIDVSTQCSSVSLTVGSEGKAHHGLNLPDFTKYALLSSESIATQRPELDMLHTA